MNTLPVILLTACVFLAAMLNLALRNRFRSSVMAACIGVAVAVGALTYPYAYAWQAGLSVGTLFKALLSICRMFSGVNDFPAAAATPLFRHPVPVALFWIGHFCAFYVTASAAIEVLGQRLLKRIRIRLLRRGSLTLVYDATPRTLRMAGAPRHGRAAVFVTDREDAALTGMAEAMGGVCFVGGPEQCASPGFLRRVGCGRRGRELNVCCLGDDGAKNLRWAEALCESLREMGVDPALTSLFLLGAGEEAAWPLMATGERYGYGSVFACETYELVARLAVRLAPPWECLTFDDAARATKDFRICIVGFGRMGRAVLKQMLMNGQMEGSAFHADVFDRDMERLGGWLEACYPELTEACDIRLHAEAAGSAAFYRALAERAPDAVALCTGDREMNGELARDLAQFFNGRGRDVRLVCCTPDAVILDGAEHRLDGVDVRGMDRRAMLVNHIYCKGPSPEDDWRQCDPFSRASSRASADFCPAFLKAGGVSEAEVLAGKWPPEGEALENLARTEHLRWCAYHLAMGYRPMSEAELAGRIERYKHGEKLRIAKDTQKKTHACLVPWEALDALSARENAATGGSVDYKRMDLDNVRVVAEILRAGQ